MSSEKYKTCKYPWQTAQILSDGLVRPCCWCAGSLGNLQDKDMEEIWYGKKAEELRSHILSGVVHSMCQDAACAYRQDTSMGL